MDYKDLDNYCKLCYSYTSYISDNKIQNINYKNYEYDIDLSLNLINDKSISYYEIINYNNTKNIKDKILNLDNFNMCINIFYKVEKVETIDSKDDSVSINNYTFYFNKENIIIKETYEKYIVLKTINNNHLDDYIIIYDNGLLSYNNSNLAYYSYNKEYNSYSDYSLLFKNNSPFKINHINNQLPTVISNKDNNYRIEYDKYGLIKNINNFKDLYYKKEDNRIISIHPHLFDVFDPKYNSKLFKYYSIDKIEIDNDIYIFERNIYEI